MSAGAGVSMSRAHACESGCGTWEQKGEENVWPQQHECVRARVMARVAVFARGLILVWGHKYLLLSSGPEFAMATRPR